MSETEWKSFFTLGSQGDYVPTRYAQSAWSDTMLNGPAVVAAAARALEMEHGAVEFQPSRLTVDLFAPVRNAPIVARTEVVRAGNRIRVADVSLLQSGEPVARATLVQLKRGEQPPGEIWLSGRAPEPPSQDLVDSAELVGHPFFGSGETGGWSQNMGAHQNAERKRYWFRPPDVIQGEDASAFQRAAIVSETTSLMTHWSTEGIGFINADLTVALARLPRGLAIGVEADEHISADGVAVGAATLFDRDGMIGTGTVVAVSNAGRQIDFSRRRSAAGTSAGGGDLPSSQQETGA